MEVIYADNLKSRSQRCCCKMCGGPIEQRVIIYNKYGGSNLELFCPVCGKIEYGTEPEIYKLAKQFVDKFDFNHFTDMEPNRGYMHNIAKVCEILMWSYKNSGLLDEAGFKVKLEMQEMDD